MDCVMLNTCGSADCRTHASLQRGVRFVGLCPESSPADAVPPGMPAGAPGHPAASGGQCRGAGLRVGRKLAVVSGQFPLCLEPERAAAAINRRRAQKAGPQSAAVPLCNASPELAGNVP